MKKVLVTGAAGSVGLLVLRYLLAEGKYEITALDLKNRDTLKKLKKYKKRVNIIYGDILNQVLMNALAKDHDVIIHLATSPLPLADMKKSLAQEIEYKGSKIIIEAIMNNNPKCHLFYASTTSLYNEDKVTIESKIKVNQDSYYNYYKYKTELLIKEKLNNYTIYRLPLILTDIRYDHFRWNGIKKEEISFITKEDAAYSFVRGLNYLDKLNKKTFNIANKETISYKELIDEMLRIYGLNFNYIFSKIFIDKNYSSPIILDYDSLNDIIDYRNDTLNSYLTKLKRRTKKRKVPIFLAKVFHREKL